MRSSRTSRLGVRGLVALVGLAALAPATADCPAADELIETLQGFDPSRGSRTAIFAEPPPFALYEKAARRIGRPVARRDGKGGIGVVVARLPVDPLWKAINDEEHHALDGRYLPVEHSEVIDGTPRGPSRVIVQAFSRWGVGRWWASRVTMNADLYRETEAALWELRWEDRMETVDRTRPQVRRVAAKVAPIRESHGAWLLVPLTADCTLVEYFTWSDPGGALGWSQALLIRRAIRQALDGVVLMAREHVDRPHPGAPFVRPDGIPLE